MTDRDELYERFRRLGIISWSGIGLAILIAIVVWVLIQLRIILFPLVLAVGLVYLANPIVDRVSRGRVPRLIGALVAFLIFGGLLALLGFAVVPTISEQVRSFIVQLPDIATDLTDQIVDLARSLGITVTLPTIASIQDWLADPANREQIIDALLQISEVGVVFVEVIAVFILAPVLALYLLVDLPGILERMRALLPPRSRDEATYVGRELGGALGGFVRGQLVVALFVGVASSFGLWLIGHDFWLVIGILAGILNLVPFIGPIFGGALAGATALVVHDLSTALWSIVVFVVVQQIDNHLISPLVLRVAVKLSPVTIILALIAGGAVGGFFGVLIAVPVVATIKVIVGHLWRTRVLGESWEEASEAMIVEYEAPPAESLIGRIRRVGDMEVSELSDELAGHEPEAPQSSPPAELSEEREPPEEAAASG